MFLIQLICIMGNAFECACFLFLVLVAVLCLNIVSRVMEVVYSRCVHTILLYYTRSLLVCSGNESCLLLAHGF